VSRVAREVFEEPDLALLLDEVSANLTYVCHAEPGTATSAAKWRVKRLKKTLKVTRGVFADSNSKFDNIADDRATLTYPE
jgi:hypothetical protein